jgi:hypothetical protein
MVGLRRRNRAREGEGGKQRAREGPERGEREADHHARKRRDPDGVREEGELAQDDPRAEQAERNGQHDSRGERALEVGGIEGLEHPGDDTENQSRRHQPRGPAAESVSVSVPFCRQPLR